MPRLLALLLLLSGGLRCASAEPLWIAVGWEARRVVSHDAVHWQDAPPLQGGPLHAIAWEGGRFIAVGGTETASLTLSTTDGEHWQPWPSSPGEIATITGGHGRLVAVRGGRLLTTTTEDRFTEGDSLPFLGEIHPRRSACGDTEAGYRYAVIGELQTPEGPVPWRGVTEDGLRWDHVARDTPPTMALVHGAGIFVAGGPNSLLETSHDGENWTRRELAAPDDLQSLLWTGERFIAQGRRIQTSLDGFTWHLEAEPAPGVLLWSRPAFPTLALSWSQGLLTGHLKKWQQLGLPAGPGIIAVAARAELP